jgi:hypothetical protein
MITRENFIKYTGRESEVALFYALEDAYKHGIETINRIKARG